MKILVCGAGVAGLATAANLARTGHDVTLVELAADVRAGGSPVDIRGDALPIAEKMGILEKLRDVQLFSTASLQYVDANGKVIARLPHDVVADSADDIEIAREDLLPILVGLLPDETDVRFRTTIESVRDHGDHVAVTLTDGHQANYGLVVGTDGARSTVRRMVFGPAEDYVSFLGIYGGFAYLGKHDTDGLPSQMYNTPGKNVGIYYYRDRALGVFMFRSPLLDYDYRDPKAQRAVIAEALQGGDWRVPEIVAAAQKDENLYFDMACQVKMDGWHRGRIVLVGDSAHCASPLSGRGTSLALSGAHFLADELNNAADGTLDEALDRYEARQRPYATKAQEGVGPASDMVLPATQEALEARNALFRSMGADPTQPGAASSG